MKAIAALFLLLLALPGRAGIVYDFHGTCTAVCDGEVYAEFLLADDYVPGDGMHCGYPALCQLQRLRYIDSTEIDDYDFTARSPAGLLLDPLGSITFPAISGPGLARFGINGGTSFDLPFRAGLDGTWQMFTEYGWQLQRLAGGTGGTFELAAHEFIPEPGTWLLLLLGLPFAWRMNERDQILGRWRRSIGGITRCAQRGREQARR